MKRVIASLMIVIALLVLTPGVAFAGSALELIQVRNDNSGPTFIFRTTGDFSKSELESGFVQVEGGDSFGLHCAQSDTTTVVCHTSKKIGGTNIVVGFGGSRFWANMPEQKFCYPVYDWNATSLSTATGWLQIARGCQETPVQEGDSVNAFNPLFNNSYLYYFFPTGNNAGCPLWENPGAGYYYYRCK